MGNWKRMQANFSKNGKFYGEDKSDEDAYYEFFDPKDEYSGMTHADGQSTISIFGTWIMFFFSALNVDPHRKS